MVRAGLQSHAESDDTSELVTELLTASRVLVAVAAKSLAALEGTLTVPQFRLLVVLRGRGPTNLSRLAEELAVNPSTAMRMIDRLVAAGLVQRSVHPDDRREILVRLTRSGHAVVRKVTAIRRTEITRIVQSMPTGSRSSLVAALLAFNEAGGEKPEDLPNLPGWQ